MAQSTTAPNFLIGLGPNLLPAILTLVLDLVQPLMGEIPIQDVRRQIVGSATLAGGQLLGLRQKFAGDVKVVVRCRWGRS